MRNKSKKMYERLSAMLLGVILLMTALSATALSAGENLITSFDRTFESYEEGTLTATDTLFTLYNASVDNTAGHDSAKSLKLTETTSAIRFIAPVEPAKNYDFSFWMRNSQEKALQLQGGSNLSGFIQHPYSYDGKTYSYYQICDGGIGDWDWKLNPYNSYLGVGTSNSNYYNADEYTFGVAREGEAADAWRKVTINFSTPPYGVTHVRLYLACVVADEKLAIDDLSLIETGDKPNRVFNGSFEGIREDKDVADVSGVSYNVESFTNTADVTVETDSQTGNTYLKVDSSINNANSFRMNWQVFSKTAAFMQGKKAGTRYKLSYKAKAVDKAGISQPGTKYTAFYFTGRDSNNDCEEYFMGSYTDEWKDFTLYFDATKLAKDALNFSGYTTQFGYYTDSEYTLYFDDVYSWYDESNIGFYKTLDFNYADAGTGDRYHNFETNYVKYEDVIMTESSIEAESLAALTPDSTGNRTVKVRAHYLPEATWGSEKWEATTVSFDETKVTLLVAVYKYETKADERKETKTLVDVKAVSGTSSENGETIDVVGEVTVPAAYEGVRYAVEAVAWNMENMAPIMEKAVLQ